MWAFMKTAFHSGFSVKPSLQQNCCSTDICLYITFICAVENPQEMYKLGKCQ